MSARPVHPVAAAVVAAAAAGLVGRASAAALRRRPPGGDARWTRTNHRGEPISLLEGPAYVVGALAGAALAPGVPPRLRAAAVLAGTAAGALGAYDDLAETGVRKGLAGHLGALARGEVTTGAVKVLGLGAAGLAASALVRAGDGTDGAGRAGGARGAALDPPHPAGVLSRAADVLVGGAVVAGTANLLNLLDLRPGRALKAVLLSSPLAAGAALPVAAAAAGSALAALPDDLAERTMLGDTGANAAGALLGVGALAAAGRSGRRARVGLLAVLVALTVASERVSFTRVIEGTPWLRRLDALGRRPPGPPR